MDKKEAREILFTLVYEYEFNRDRSAADIYDIAREERKFEPFRYIKKGLTDIASNRNYLSDLIEQYAENWSTERIAPVTRSILFIGAYDMIFKSTPASIAINEAVELAKKYDEEASASFVNGILNGIAQNIDTIKAQREVVTGSDEE